MTEHIRRDELMNCVGYIVTYNSYDEGTGDVEREFTSLAEAEAEYYRLQAVLEGHGLRHSLELCGFDKDGNGVTLKGG